MFPAVKEMILLFKIAKEQVSFERTDVTVSAKSSEIATVKKEEMDLLYQQVIEKARMEAEALLAETAAQAEAMKADAQKSADSILREANDRVASIEQEAKEIGYAEGYQAGQKKANIEAAARKETESEEFQTLLKNINEQRVHMIENLEAEIVSLVINIVKKIIKVKLKEDDQIFLNMIADAIGQLKSKGKIIVRVAEEQYQELFSEGNQTFKIDDQLVSVTVIEEGQFSDGDCIIETVGEAIDIGINTQIKYIEMAFLNDGSLIA